MRIFTRMSVAFVISLIAAVMFLSSTISSTSAGNWPQWRGPEGQGVSRETGLPVEWSATTDRGILTCLNAKTGELVYEGGRVPIPATFTASPVAFDGKILLTSEDGDTFMVRAGPKHELLGSNTVGEPVYASPAIADGRIFIRGENNLYAIGN